MSKERKQSKGVRVAVDILPLRVEIAKLVKAYATRSGWTQKQAADALGWGLLTYRNHANGKSDPKITVPADGVGDGETKPRKSRAVGACDFRPRRVPVAKNTPSARRVRRVFASKTARCGSEAPVVFDGEMA